MTPEQEMLALDRFIDEIQRGATMAGDQIDTEFADLAATVMEIRRLAEPEWPDDDFPSVASVHISRALRARTMKRDGIGEPDEWPASSNGHTPLKFALARHDAENKPRAGRRQFRDVAQMAAAILALVLVAGLLAVVFGNQAGRDQAGVGGSATSAPSTVSERELSALQAKTGFQIYAPTWLPDGWTMQPLEKPFNLTRFSEVILTFVDSGRTQGLNIWETSPYQSSVDAIPASISGNARPIDLGNGRTGQLFHQADLIRLWWKEGDVAIQFQNGITGPTAPVKQVISEGDVIRIARSMTPVVASMNATPESTVSMLPMTVRANGIPVTLAAAWVGSTTTRLFFRVALPSDIAGASDILVRSADSSTLVEMSGLRAGTNDPVWQFSLHHAGDSTAMFSLEYGAVPAADQPVTITVLRLPFTATPSDPNTVQGPWTFTLSGANLAAQSIAMTNTNRQHANLSVRDAQALIDFPIVEPSPLPSVLARPDRLASAVTLLAGDAPSADLVRLFYPARNDGPNGVTVSETHLSITVPYVIRNELHVIGADGTPAVLPAGQWTQDSVSIAGLTVLKLNMLQRSVNSVYYSWEQNGVFFVVTAEPDVQVTDAIVEQMIASMIDHGAVTSTPAQPTSSRGALTFAQAKQMAPFYVAVPTWLPDYLVEQSVSVDGTPILDSTNNLAQIRFIIANYALKNRPQDYVLQIGEQVAQLSTTPPEGKSSDLQIGGHTVRSIMSLNGSSVYFTWQDQGTTVQMTAHMTSPVTEQDLEHIVDTMLKTGNDTPAATP